MILRVQTEYFTAGAIWRKIYSIWSCVETAPILHWMRGMSARDAQTALLKMGAHFEWIKPHSQLDPNAGTVDPRLPLQPDKPESEDQPQPAHEAERKSEVRPVTA